MKGNNDPLKILLVEDNQGDARIIEELLKEDVNNQFLISHASRLETALNYLPEYNFDLILLDLHLEDSDGIRTFTVMEQEAADLPIIILTGLSDENFAINAIVKGAQDFLIKGQFDSQALVRSIKYSIERKKALEEKDLLLKEIHHRIKNNLRTISTLLNFQSQYIRNEDDLELFRESEVRANTMALIHEYLHRSDNLKRINFGEYLQMLISAIFKTYSITPDNLNLNLDIEDVIVDVDTAIPLGLVVNELLTNSIKHAFPDGRKGEISIKLKSTNDKFSFAINDDGIGIPDNVDPENTDTLGLKLVNLLTEQLKGEIELKKDNGTNFTIKNLVCCPVDEF